MADIPDTSDFEFVDRTSSTSPSTEVVTDDTNLPIVEAHQQQQVNDELATCKTEINKLTLTNEVLLDIIERLRREKRLAVDKMADAKIGCVKKITDNKGGSTEQDDVTAQIRTVEIQKKDGLIGINVLDGSIAKITEGGAAHIKGELKRGDQIIAVDGIDVEMMSNNEISELIKLNPHRVKLAVRYNPERLFDGLEKEIGEIDNTFSRAEYRVHRAFLFVLCFIVGAAVVLVVLLAFK